MQPIELMIGELRVIWGLEILQIHPGKCRLHLRHNILNTLGHVLMWAAGGMGEAGLPWLVPNCLQGGQTVKREASVCWGHRAGLGWCPGIVHRASGRRRPLSGRCDISTRSKGIMQTFVCCQEALSSHKSSRWDKRLTACICE